MNWIEPKRLAPGMTIGIMAPASASDEDLHKIEEICASKGYKVFWGDSVHRKGLYGGTPEEQATEFQYMMTTAPCDAVLALRAGCGPVVCGVGSAPHACAPVTASRAGTRPWHGSRVGTGRVQWSGRYEAWAGFAQCARTVLSFGVSFGQLARIVLSFSANTRTW